LFAPVHVETAAVLGAGVQAWWQSLALFHERPFRRLLIWARDAGKADKLIGRLAAKLPAVAFQRAQSAEDAVRSADVVITATLSRQPIVRGAWLRPGQHITAVGADDPTKCELDREAFRRARVFVDERASAMANGDIHAAAPTDSERAKLIDAEIGDVLAQPARGRTSDDQITLAKLVGIGAQDVAAVTAAIKALKL
ncbi:MAG: ornithine cyclodeaminase family protein, partial [Novosphingobium sp.]